MELVGCVLAVIAGIIALNRMSIQDSDPSIGYFGALIMAVLTLLMCVGYGWFAVTFITTCRCYGLLLVITLCLVYPLWRAYAKAKYREAGEDPVVMLYDSMDIFRVYMLIIAVISGLFVLAGKLDEVFTAAGCGLFYATYTRNRKAVQRENEPYLEYLRTLEPDKDALERAWKRTELQNAIFITGASHEFEKHTQSMHEMARNTWLHDHWVCRMLGVPYVDPEDPVQLFFPGHDEAPESTDDSEASGLEANGVSPEPAVAPSPCGWYYEDEPGDTTDFPS